MVLQLSQINKFYEVSTTPVTYQSLMWELSFHINEKEHEQHSVPASYHIFHVPAIEFIIPVTIEDNACNILYTTTIDL